jgi:prolyl-tRNA synthetase
MIMGCYGIGISRVVAAAIEQSHDDYGIIWPEPLAPFTVALVAIDYDSNPEVKKHADEIAAALEAKGISVLLDDRDERPGIKFKDMDLIGLPHRLVVSSRTVADGQCEYKNRKEKDSVRWNLAEAVAELEKRIAK